MKNHPQPPIAEFRALPDLCVHGDDGVIEHINQVVDEPRYNRDALGVTPVPHSEELDRIHRGKGIRRGYYCPLILPRPAVSLLSTGFVGMPQGIFLEVFATRVQV